MKNTQLYALIGTLDDSEVRKIRKWLQSPAHNYRSDTAELFDLLTQSEDENKPFDKEAVFQMLYPGTPYNDARLRQAGHFLFKRIESFLVYQHLEENELEYELTLARIYKNRRLENLSQKKLRRARQKLEESGQRNQEYHKQAYQLALEDYEFLSRRKRTETSLLQEVSDGLDTAFIVEKLRQSCILQSHLAVVKTGYHSGLLDGVLTYVEAQDLLETPAVGIYYHIYLAQQEGPGSTHYEPLRKLIQESEGFFDQDELQEIYLLTLNYCIKCANAGHRAQYFLRQSFEIYKRGIATGFLLEQGQIDRYTFLNVLRNALRLKEYDWAENFIENYRHMLPKQHQGNIIPYSLARLHYEQKNYDQAMKLLVHADFSDILLHLNAKSILAKMYYEQDEIDALDSLLDSMRTYLHRKKVLGYQRQIYQHFIQLTRRLTRLRPYDQTAREKLRKAIETTSPLTEKEWLLKQVEAVHA